jgi:hypothetical protein
LVLLAPSRPSRKMLASAPTPPARDKPSGCIRGLVKLRPCLRAQSVAIIPTGKTVWPAHFARNDGSETFF